MRIMPRINEEVNEEWISDKSRFVWDGLGRQRLDTPYVRGSDGRLHRSDWNAALDLVASKLKIAGEKIGFIAGDLVEVEQAYAALSLARSLGVESTDCRPEGARYGTDGVRERYILNPTLMGVEEADALLLIGTNPRKEAPVWNARIRKAWLWNGLQVGMVGEGVDLTYDYTHVGDDPKAIGAKGDFLDVLKNAKRPMIVVGEGALCRADGDAVLAAAHKLALDVGAISEDWAGFGVLHNAAGRVGALDLGFVPTGDGRDTAGVLAAAIRGDIETVVLLGADELELVGTDKAFVVYVGHHGDAGASRADVVLPATAYTEMSATYVNTEGRVQRTTRAVGPKGEAKEGWAIFRAISERVGKTLPFDSLSELRERLIEEKPVFGGLGFAPGTAGAGALKEKIEAKSELSDSAFEAVIGDFYQTNPIARASKTMAECSAQARGLETPVAAE